MLKTCREKKGRAILTASLLPRLPLFAVLATSRPSSMNMSDDEERDIDSDVSISW